MWDNIKNFLLSDPFKVISEFQTLIRVQVPQKQLMNQFFFSKIIQLSYELDALIMIRALPPNLKIISDVLSTIVRYIEHR